MKKEKTLILIKPDGLARQLIGKIISKFEDSGLKIIGMKLTQASEELALKHYRNDISKKHGEKVRNSLIKYIKEGPIVAIVLEGIDGIHVTRKIVGSTYPNESLPGTIRGDFAHISKDYANKNEINIRNLIHASENKEDSDIEIALWFKPDELLTYKTVHDIICLKK